ESALRINPESPEALHLQAQALSFSGQVERALNIVNKAIPLSSNPLPLLLQRARLITQSEGPQANLEALRSIAEEYPDEPVVLAPLAEALTASGNDLEAIQCAQQALHRSGGELPLDEQAKLHNLLGSLLQQSGQLDQSIHHLSEAIRISPSSLDSYLTLGSTQAERRQYEQALETYQQAIRMHPYDPRPYYQAGLLLKASRDYPAAEKMLRKAAEKAPDDISIHRQLAALVALNLVHNRQPVSSEV
ncbi:MAG: tetratricopeptide repeat protein, partial [Anaerolineales bacterium]